MYGDTPLGWDIAGQKQVIRKLHRDDFLEYTQGLYAPNIWLFPLPEEWEKTE